MPTLEIITSSDGTGQNCADRVLAALAIAPEHRAVIGSLLVQGCRDLRTGQISWAKPWGHHIWLVEPDGHHYDPSACNLAHWARVQEMELPRPWGQLSATVIEASPEQSAVVRRLLRSPARQPDLPDAIYLPGLVYSTDVEELPSSPAYVTAWGRLAIESVRAGGWTADQLRDGLARVPELMAGAPRIKSTPVPLHRRRDKHRAGRGFGLEVCQ